MNRILATPSHWAKRGAVFFLGLALAVLSIGCSLEEEDEGLSGPFGPGQGGPAPLVGTLRTSVLTGSSGAPFGRLDYDDGYFSAAPGPGTDSLLFVYNDLVGDLVQLIVTRISGRPDTPCRFSAAVLARDEGFAILAAGDRTNALGLEFHQVNLRKDAVHVNFYCTRMQNNLGIQIAATSLAGNNLGTLQMHFLLNSVRR